MNTKLPKFHQAVAVGIIDSQRLLELRELDNGSTSFAMDLIEDFILQKNEFFLELDTSLNKKDLNGLKKTAHKLKSSLANIAAGRASKACAKIEKEANADIPIDAVQVLVENLKQEISYFLNSIK